MYNTVEAAIAIAHCLVVAREGSQASLVPDPVRVESWNEVVVEVDDTIPECDISLKSSSSLMTLFPGTSCSDDHGHRPSPPVLQPTRMKTQTQMQMRTRTRARIHVEGMRVTVHDFAYYPSLQGCTVLRDAAPLHLIRG